MQWYQIAHDLYPKYHDLNNMCAKYYGRRVGSMGLDPLSVTS